MKKHKIITLFTGILFCTAVFAQQLVLDNVPQEVQSTFREKFPSAENVSWGIEPNGNYEAKFMMANAKERAEFDTVISAGLLAASFPALDGDGRYSQLICYILLSPVACDTLLA